MRSAARAFASFGFAFGLVVLASTGVSAVGPGQTCGGVGGIPCDAGLFCQAPTGKCGPDTLGKCVKVPEICNARYLPVCGCDNKTYGNDCNRQAAKVSKKHDGACRTPTK